MDGLEFSVTLEDGISPGAEKASSSLEHMQTELEGTSKELERMGRAQAQAIRMNEAFDAKQDASAQRLGRVQAEANRMNEEFDRSHSILGMLTGGFQKVIEPTEVLRHAFEGLAEGAHELSAGLASGDVEGVIGGMSTAMAGLAESLDLVVPGLGQVASAAIRAGGALAGATAGIVEEAVKTALEVTETNERLEATFDALGHGPEAGRKTLDMLNDLARELPQSRDQLGRWTQQFEAMGVTDLGELRQQVVAVASAQAIAGESGASAYEGLEKKIRGAIDANEGMLKIDSRLIKQLHELGAGDMLVGGQRLLRGMAVDASEFGDALSEAMETKGKGALSVMWTEMSTLKEKAGEAFAHLFDGIDTEPLTDALTSLLHMSEDSGDELHKGIVGAIDAIIYELGELVWDAEIAFLKMELFATRSAPQIETVEKAIHDVGAAFEWTLEHADRLAETIASMIPGLSTVMGVAGVARNAAGAIHALGGTGTVEHASPNSAGGLVQRPAPGEYLASVSPGERIVPEGRGDGTHIEHVEINITAPHGVTDAHQMSVTGLALAFERLQLAAGR